MSKSRPEFKPDYTNQYPIKLRCECEPRAGRMPALWNLAGYDTVNVCSSCGHSR